MAPPRLQPFTDPSAEVVWAAICALDEGSQHEVLEELRQRLAAADLRETPQQTRQARAVAALRECAAIVARAPSKGEYERERVDHPEWPPESTVRSWLGGSWAKALEAARLATDLTGETATHAIGPEFTKAEVKAALCSCAAEIAGESIPGLHTYLAWARRRDIRQRPGRRPRSQSVFDRLYGGYLQALVAAGLIEGAGDAAAPRSGATRAASGYRYSEEQLLAGLDLIVRHGNGGQHLGADDPFPSTGAYARARQELIDKAEDAGEPPRALPSQQVLWRKWGGWAEVQKRYREATGSR